MDTIEMVMGGISANASRCLTRRRTMAAVGILVTESLLVGCGGGKRSQATFTGRVVDANDGDTPVPGAVVTLGGRSTTTGADGSFSLQVSAFASITNATVVGPNDNLGQPLYFYDGFYGGVQYNLTTTGFPVQPILAGESRNLGTVKLGSILATLTGRVVDFYRSDVVQGATITLNGHSTTTRADGSFRFRIPAFTSATHATVVGPNDNSGQPLYYGDGFYDGIYHDFAGSGFLVQPIPAGEARNLGTVKLIKLGTLATFTGNVIDLHNSNAAVQGAVITLNGRSTMTSADGSFSFQAPAFANVTNATVVGPNASNGQPLYYRDGFYGGIRYNLATTGFPVQPILANESRNLGTIMLGNVSGPPFPP